jgi:ATP-dependent exoDNAse (exonuclease V) beta subunit
VLTDAELLAADRDARLTALDVSRSFIVQAPAGSGKTELLIQRYLKLLTVCQNPEEVLAITFTRKAAMEMHFRVANALRRARDNAKCETAHERLTLEIAAEVLSRDRELNWRLTHSPGRMRIETVDAFGASIARSLPLSSGIGGVTAALTDASISTLYRSAAAATLDWLAAENDAAKSVERVLLHLDNNTYLYITYLAKMLATRAQWLAFVGSGPADDSGTAAVRRRLEASIGRRIEAQLRRLEQLIPLHCRTELLDHLRYAANNLAAGNNAAHPLVWFLDKTELPGSDVAAREAWQAVASLLLIRSGAWRKSVNKNDGFPAGDSGQKESLCAFIDGLHDVPGLQEDLIRVRDLPPPSYSDAQWQVLLALFELLPIAVAELSRLFSERGVTDHPEIALAAQKALGSAEDPGDIAMALDYRIRHLLIDEMQDTSISQYDLLRSLTAGWTPGDGRTVFCVGDPMQSIYRFRDAEVGEFLLARKNGIGTVPLTSLLLRRNFRSGEHLVHWFNTVFSQVMPLRDDISTSAIAYSESVPVEIHAGAGEVQVHPLFDVTAAAEAAYTFDVIRRCLDQHTDDSIAVLVRSRTQLTFLLRELRHAGVEYQAIEIDRLTDLPEMIDVIALTRALCHEQDRLAWLALLRSPWVGFTWQQLHALVCNDADSSILQLLQDEQRTATLASDIRPRLRSFLSVIELFNSRHAAGNLRDRVESAWFALGGPALLGDTGQLENVYRYFDVLGKLTLAGTLEDVGELERLLDDERVSSSAGNACRLQVMTMHKAKGLQFDHVVLHGLGRMTRGSDPDVINWLSVPDEDGQTDMIISPVGARAVLDRDPLHNFIAKMAKQKSNAELDRLLYVACTRAKKSLHLVGHVGVNAQADGYKPRASGSLLGRLWPAIEPVFATAFENHQSSPDGELEIDGDNLVTPILQRLNDNWRAAELPPAPGKHQSLPVSETAELEDQVEFYWVGSAARYAGTIVHKMLQKISDRELNAPNAAIADLRPLSMKWALAIGVNEDMLEDVCDRVVDAIRKTSNDSHGRWVLHGEGRAELALSGLYRGELTSIVIDRIRIGDDGTHWIIDYKTSTHEGGDLPGFLRQEAERYRPQLEKYAAIYSRIAGAPVRAALYFPLLQEFCEVALQE